MAKDLRGGGAGRGDEVFEGRAGGWGGGTLGGVISFPALFTGGLGGLSGGGPDILKELSSKGEDRTKDQLPGHEQQKNELPPVYRMRLTDTRLGDKFR